MLYDILIEPQPVVEILAVDVKDVISYESAESW